MVTAEEEPSGGRKSRCGREQLSLPLCLFGAFFNASKAPLPWEEREQPAWSLQTPLTDLMVAPCRKLCLELSEGGNRVPPLLFPLPPLAFLH